MEDVVNLLGGADSSWYLHLLHAAVGARADSGASESHVRQHERPQLRMLVKKIDHFDEQLIRLPIRRILLAEQLAKYDLERAS